MPAQHLLLWMENWYQALAAVLKPDCSNGNARLPRFSKSLRLTVDHGQAGLMEEADPAMLEKPDGENSEGEEENERQEAHAVLPVTLLRFFLRGDLLHGAAAPLSQAQPRDWGEDEKQEPQTRHGRLPWSTARARLRPLGAPSFLPAATAAAGQGSARATVLGAQASRRSWQGRRKRLRQAGSPNSTPRRRSSGIKFA
ncbi:hypothetical protein E2320_004663 [Naja naja]|nr:hypothetical protein E2320_004663 [Naja naja]